MHIEYNNCCVFSFVYTYSFVSERSNFLAAIEFPRKFTGTGSDYGLECPSPPPKEYEAGVAYYKFVYYKFVYSAEVRVWICRPNMRLPTLLYPVTVLSLLSVFCTECGESRSWG